MLADVYRIWYTQIAWRCSAIGPPMVPLKKVPAYFWRSASGNEPVRDWLRSLSQEDRKTIGADVKTVEYGWPIGMPACRPLGGGLHEVRSRLPDGRIARVLVCIDAEQRMILLHGFIKKSEKTPRHELDLARSRMP